MEIRPYLENELGNVLISKDMGDIVKSDEWEKVQGKIGDSIQLSVVFDEVIGKKLNINPNKPASYKDYKVEPTVRITLSRKKQDTDDDLFNKMIVALKNDGVLKHGHMIVRMVCLWKMRTGANHFKGLRFFQIKYTTKIFINFFLSSDSIKFFQSLGSSPFSRCVHLLLFVKST